MHKFWLSLIYLLLVFSCHSKMDLEIVSLLDRAENYLEHNPDSSLLLLNTIKLNDISSDAFKARYALLKSIALDKNYIDVTNDSLTSIAVAYYKKHGTVEEKLKSYLYNGRVYVNSKNYEKAMDNYLCAEEYAGKCGDHIIVGRLYSVKSVLYNTIFDFKQAINQAHLASEYFLKGGDTTRYLNNLTNVAVIIYNSGSYDSAAECIKQLEQYRNRLNSYQKGVYFSVKLNLIPKSDTVAIRSMIDTIHTSGIGETNINWLALSDGYFNIGDIKSSLESLHKHSLTGGITDATYYVLLSKIYSSVGEYEQAYKNLVISDDLLKGRYYKATQTDTKYLEERYLSNIREIKHHYLIGFLALGVLFITVLLIIIYKQRIKENKFHKYELERMSVERENYELKYHEVINEQEKLKEIIESNRTRTQLDPQMLILLKQRFALLDKFIMANISSVYTKDALNELNQLVQDREQFLESTRLAFSLSHSVFIEHLQKKGLTDREVSYCCLYCIGLNGSEISNYLDIKSFYNISKVIRKKLSIDRSINIDTYLRKILVE